MIVDVELISDMDLRKVREKIDRKDALFLQ